MNATLHAIAEPLDGYDVGLAMTSLGTDSPPELFQSDGLRALRPGYAAGAHRIDPFNAHLCSEPIPTGEVVPSEANFPRPAMTRTDYFAEWLNPLGYSWGPDYAVILDRRRGELCGTALSPARGAAGR